MLRQNSGKKEGKRTGLFHIMLYEKNPVQTERKNEKYAFIFMGHRTRHPHHRNAHKRFVCRRVAISYMSQHRPVGAFGTRAATKPFVGEQSRLVIGRHMLKSPVSGAGIFQFSSSSPK